MHSYKHMSTAHSHWKGVIGLAPRQDLQFYILGLRNMQKASGWGMDLNARLAEWSFLYRQIPEPGSWIWQYYNTTAMIKLRSDGMFPWITSKDEEELRFILPNSTIMPARSEWESAEQKPLKQEETAPVLHFGRHFMPGLGIK